MTKLDRRFQLDGKATSCQSYSEKMWGVRWRELVPKQLATGIFLEPCSVETFGKLFQEQFAEAMSPTNGFVSEILPHARNVYLREHADLFLIRSDDEPVGYVICNPTDWSTYYLRSTAVLPSFQRRGIFSQLLVFLGETLATLGVARLVLDTNPMNTPVLRATQRQGFAISGQRISERWGALVELTRFLQSGHRRAFQSKYVPNDTFKAKTP